MKFTLATLMLIASTSLFSVAQTGSPKEVNGAAQEIIQLEKKWNDTIQRRDRAKMKDFLSDGYFLAIAIDGRPLQIVPRTNWLENLQFYKIQSYSIDDIKVHVYGDTAVVMMLYTQKATVGRNSMDRSAQFLITDIWVKQKEGWRVAERHSSRPEPASSFQLTSRP